MVSSRTSCNPVIVVWCFKIKEVNGVGFCSLSIKAFNKRPVTEMCPCHRSMNEIPKIPPSMVEIPNIPPSMVDPIVLVCWVLIKKRRGDQVRLFTCFPSFSFTKNKLYYRPLTHLQSIAQYVHKNWGT